MLFGLCCLCFVLLFGLSCTQAPSQANDAVHLLEPQRFVAEYRQDSAAAYLIDCRTPDEFDRGALPGAINIDYRSSSFRQNLRALDTTKSVYVYCQAGGRSAAAAKVLQDAGFRSVSDMKGGYTEYEKLPQD